MQLRVKMEYLPTPDDCRAQSLRPDDVMVRVEVFDNATPKQFIVPATTKGFNPQPEPPAANQPQISQIYTDQNFKT
jgi:hypothetical protein